MRAEIETLQHEIGSLHSSSGGLRMSIEQCKRYESDHQRGGQELRERVQTLRAELARLERDKEEAISRREAALAALHSEQARESSLQDAKALAEREHASALAQAQAYEKESAVQQAAVVQVTAELDAARAKAQAQRHAADEARKLLRALQSQRALLTDCTSRAQQEIAGITEEYNKVKQDVEALQRQRQEAKRAEQAAAGSKSDRLKALQALQAQRNVLLQQQAQATVGHSNTTSLPPAYRPDVDEDEDMSLGALRAAAAASHKTPAPKAVAEIAVQTEPTSVHVALPAPAPASVKAAQPGQEAALPLPAAVGGPKAGSPTLKDPQPEPSKCEPLPAPIPVSAQAKSLPHVQAQAGKGSAQRPVAAGSPGEEPVQAAVPAPTRGRTPLVPTGKAGAGQQAGKKRSKSSLSVSAEPKARGEQDGARGKKQTAAAVVATAAVQAVQEARVSAPAPSTVRKGRQTGKGKGRAQQAKTPAAATGSAPALGTIHTPAAAPPDDSSDDDDDMFSPMALLTMPGGVRTHAPHAHTTVAAVGGNRGAGKGSTAPTTGLLAKAVPAFPPSATHGAGSPTSSTSSPSPVAVLFNTGTDWLFQDLA